RGDWLGVELMQAEDRSLGAGEPLERVAEQLRVLDLVRDCRAMAARVELGVEGDLADARPAAQLGAAGVDDDPLEPGVEVARLAQLAQLPPGRDERLLDRVPRVGVVAEDRPGRPERPVQLARDDALEGGLVAGGGAADELDAARLDGRGDRGRERPRHARVPTVAGRATRPRRA